MSLLHESSPVGYESVFQKLIQFDNLKISCLIFFVHTPVLTLEHSIVQSSTSSVQVIQH